MHLTHSARAAAVVVAAATCLTVVAATSPEAAVGDPPARRAAGAAGSTDAAGIGGRLDAALRAVVAAGAPAATATVVVPEPAVAAGAAPANVQWSGAGLADRATGVPPAPGDRWRVASVTKPFVATVLLQLVAEGRIGLDEPGSRYLPGAVPAALHVTIRELLQHTSGLADYHEYDGLDSAAAYLRRRFDDPPAAQSIALAVAHSPLFPAGSSWFYADTNYLVLGQVIERVTGHSVGSEITSRIIRPLRLTGTSYPEHDPAIRGRHLHGYLPADLPGQPYADQAHLTDFTAETVDQTGPAGALISTGPDLLRFFQALLGGRLLPAALMAQMTQTVPVGAAGSAVGMVGEGLGIEEFDLGCGPVWGHAGSIRGYTTLVLASRDATREAALVVTENPLPDAAVGPALGAAATAICAGT